MKKKVTNDDVAKVIGKLADEIRSDLDYDFRVAQSQMALAENDLVETLDKKQKALYDDFCQKREKFFAIAKELYKRKF